MFKKILTNPKEHNPDDFVYLVHGLMDWDFSGLTSQEMEDHVSKIRNPNQFYSASMIARLNGESAKRRIGWHDGSISQTSTFGLVGLILGPADDTIIQIAWNCDIGSPHDPSELGRFVQKHKGKIRYPLTLLTQTKGSPYNELILRGDERTDIKGVFYTPINPKEERNGKILAEIVSEVMQSEVPVIQLPTPQIKSYDNIQDTKEREKLRELDFLRTQTNIMQAHLEFIRPELFRRELFEKPYLVKNYFKEKIF